MKKLIIVLLFVGVRAVAELQPYNSVSTIEEMAALCARYPVMVTSTNNGGLFMGFTSTGGAVTGDGTNVVNSTCALNGMSTNWFWQRVTLMGTTPVLLTYDQLRYVSSLNPVWVAQGSSTSDNRGGLFRYALGSALTTNEYTVFSSLNTTMPAGQWIRTPSRFPSIFTYGTVRTTTYTQQLFDYVIPVDPTSGSFTVTLLAAASLSGRILEIINLATSSANAVTVDANASETINLVPTVTLTAGQSIRMICDGSNWKILGDFKMPSYGFLTDRGDADYTVTAATPYIIPYDSALGANRTVSFTTNNMMLGQMFKVARTSASGAFTLDVGGLDVIPASTAGWVEVQYIGSAMRLTASGVFFP